MRATFQAGFLLLTIIGVFVVAGNAEAWCPFGGIEGLYNYFTEGSLPCSLGVSNFYILAAVLVMTITVRRAFCGYMCPVGTASDWVRRLGAHLGARELTVPRGLDRALSLIKYAVLIAVVYFTCRTAELVFRGYDPCYALISRHGEDITPLAYAISAGILLVSLFVTMPFCRWLCPLAAALNPFSRFGLARIKRDESTCTQCGHCSAVCPMNIPVHEVAEVKQARCISCLSCVDACPTHSESSLVWGPPPWLARSLPRSVLAGVLLMLTTAAVATSSLLGTPSFVSTRGLAPARLDTVELEIEGLTCRGKATLLVYFLERDDGFELSEFVELRAWPGPGAARAHVVFDPDSCSRDDVKRAIVEPYFDNVAHIWRFSPFSVRGFDPLEDVLDK